MKLTIKQIAMIAHEANRTYCHIIGEMSGSWESLGISGQEAAINGVTFLWQNPSAGPKESHNVWVRCLEENGWEWAETKDEARRYHPNMLPFWQLAPAQQMKDMLYVAIVRTLLGPGMAMKDETNRTLEEPIR